MPCAPRQKTFVRDTSPNMFLVVVNTTAWPGAVHAYMYSEITAAEMPVQSTETGFILDMSQITGV